MVSVRSRAVSAAFTAALALVLSGCAPCEFNFQSDHTAYACTLGMLEENCCHVSQGVAKAAGPAIVEAIDVIYSNPGLSEEEKRQRASEAAGDALKSAMTQDAEEEIKNACGVIDGVALASSLMNPQDICSIVGSGFNSGTNGNGGSGYNPGTNGDGGSSYNPGTNADGGSGYNPGTNGNGGSGYNPGTAV